MAGTILQSVGVDAIGDTTFHENGDTNWHEWSTQSFPSSWVFVTQGRQDHQLGTYQIGRLGCVGELRPSWGFET